jgi:hypothetical protein
VLAHLIELVGRSITNDDYLVDLLVLQLLADVEEEDFMGLVAQPAFGLD